MKNDQNKNTTPEEAKKTAKQKVDDSTSFLAFTFEKRKKQNDLFGCVVNGKETELISAIVSCMKNYPTIESLITKSFLFHQKEIGNVIKPEILSSNNNGQKVITLPLPKPGEA